MSIFCDIMSSVCYAAKPEYDVQLLQHLINRAVHEYIIIMLKFFVPAD